MHNESFINLIHWKWIENNVRWYQQNENRNKTKNHRNFICCKNPSSVQQSTAQNDWQTFLLLMYNFQPQLWLSFFWFSINFNAAVNLSCFLFHSLIIFVLFPVNIFYGNNIAFVWLLQAVANTGQLHLEKVLEAELHQKLFSHQFLFS